MSIANFPAALQPIIQQGFLSRKFRKGLESRLGFREVAERKVFPNRVGQTITDTVRGLKAPITTPTSAAANTGLDNGIAPSSFAVEQFSMGIDQYDDSIDLNMVAAGVAIASQFVENSYVNGMQAKQSLDRLARNNLYFGTTSVGVLDVGGYLGGNTRVIDTLGAPATTVHVDDIRGFTNIIGPLGVVTAVSFGTPSVVAINGTAYTLVGVVPDGAGANVSTAPNGMSGVLNFTANVAVADATLNNPVVVSTAPVVLRPNNRKTTAALVAGDTLSMQVILKAVAQLRSNGVPAINGLYNCYLDEMQLLSLFADPQFQVLFRGAYDSKEFRQGEVFELLGVRYITTNEAPQQASLGAGSIHRAIICGKGALIEGDYENIGHSDIPDGDKALMEMVDGVCMVTREPLDRLKQIIAQSWYWIGGFALPSERSSDLMYY
jgi:hypothetical protein